VIRLIHCSFPPEPPFDDVPSDMKFNVRSQTQHTFVLTRRIQIPVTVSGLHKSAEYRARTHIYSDR
jgi:hypothetical protein